MVIALGVLWTGFLVVSWGRHMLAGDGVGLADLAVPGHYAKNAAPSVPAQPVTSTAPPPGGSGGGGGAHALS